MSADRRPSWGLADRVLSTLTASTGPYLPVRRPVKGWTRAAEGDGLADDAAAGGRAGSAGEPWEQAVRAIPATHPAQAADMRERVTSRSFRTRQMALNLATLADGRMIFPLLAHG